MYITTQSALDKAISQIKKEKVIALDTEFVRTKTFYPHLSVLQIGYASTTCAIDAQCDLDMSAAIELLSDPKILKIVHAAKQDVEVLKFNLGVQIENIFDTQIAAQFLGFPEAPSYDKLVLKYCDMQISKAMQFSDWSERPLTEEQINYALLDVKYLISIYNSMKSDLVSAKLWDWSDEEMQDPKSFEISESDPIEILAKFQNHFYKESELTMLYKLIKMREEVAKSQDKNRARIMRDDHMIAAVRSNQLSSRTRRVLGIENQDIHRMPISAEETHKIQKLLENSRKRYDYDKNKFNALRALLHSCAEKYGIASSLIANRDELIKLVRNQKHNIRSLKGWRHKVFGEEAEQLLESLSHIQ